MSTVNAFMKLGVKIEDKGKKDNNRGQGYYGLKEPADIIDCGNSGTTMRLLSGVLSGNPFLSVLTGDSSLRSRPMGRVITPFEADGSRNNGKR